MHSFPAVAGLMGAATDPPASPVARSPDPAVVTDRHQRIVEVNPPAARLFGYPAGELLGRPLDDLVPRLDSAPAPGEFTAVVARHRDGTPMRLRVTCAPVPADGRLTATFFHAPEVGAADREEATLGRLPIAVLRFDAGGRVVYANARASELAGRPRSELLGRRPTEFAVASPTARAWATVVDEVLRTGLPERLELRAGRQGAEWWFDATLIPERDPASGEPTVLLAAFDITPHHQAQAQLEASELRFRRLAEGSQDLVSQHAADGRFLYASPAASDLFGLEPDALIGRPLADLVAPADRPGLAGAFRAALAGERPQPVAFAVSRPDGRELSCELTAHAADPGERGEPTLICITRDITERVRGEEILRAASRMEASATLAAGVAHDFNNLMTGILGNAELLLADLGAPDAAARLGQIAEGARQGGALAQQLLAYARGGKYQASAVCLNELVRQTLHLQRHATPPTIRHEEDLAPDLPAVVADPVQLGQVLTNLCLNAVEAIAGRGRITVRTRAVTLAEADLAGRAGLSPGRHVLVTVEDTGAGIPAPVQPRIFEPFFSTKFQGRGLGLAAAWGIVRNHGGVIEVASVPGEGTTFSVWLPATAEAARPAAPARGGVPTGSETVLLVDDDDAVVDVTRTILGRLGYRVLVARNGLEAVEAARTHPGPIDLAILDMGMPVAGGADVFPALQEARPGMRILLSSGYEMNEVVERLLAAGAAAFLQKPYRLAGLAAGIRRVLDGEARGERLDD